MTGFQMSCDHCIFQVRLFFIKACDPLKLELKF